VNSWLKISIPDFQFIYKTDYVMKKALTVLLVCLLAFTFLYCTKEGERGPRGPAGADGNANVKTYIFTDSLELSWTGAGFSLLYDSVFSIPDSIRTEGMVLIYMEYYMLPDWWYAAPGMGAGGYVLIRTGFDPNRVMIIALDPDGKNWSSSTPPPAVKTVRVILVPPSEVIMMRKLKETPDLSDPVAALDYFSRRESIN